MHRKKLGNSRQNKLFLNTKVPGGSSQYEDVVLLIKESQNKDMAVLQPSYLHDGNPIPRRQSLY